MFDIPISLIITLLTAVITGLLGLVTNILSNKINRQKELEKESVENLLETYTAQADKAKAELLKVLSQQLPDTANDDEFRQRILAGNVVINQVTKTDGQLIENLVNSYHQQALSQAKVQFWFSVIAATVGFAFILFVALSSLDSGASVLLKILPGVVIDAVAILFFRQAEQTRQRATELYDRLRADNQATMAKELLSLIEDVKVRSIAQAQIALHLSGVVTKDFDVSLLLDKISYPRTD